MQKKIEELMKNRIFKGLEIDELKEVINILNYRLKTYEKNQVIAYEDDDCDSIGLIIEGKVIIERLYPSGKEIVMKSLEKGEVFGEAIIFSEFHKYPATVIAAEDSKIFYLSKSEVIKLFSFNSKFMENFMGLLSEKVIILNNKIKSLSLKTIKQKVVDYILQECILQKSETIKLKGSKEELALYLGIPRPSLSRELIKLREDGLIDFDRHVIKVIDLEELEEVLFNW